MDVQWTPYQYGTITISGLGFAPEATFYQQPSSLYRLVEEIDTSNGAYSNPTYQFGGNLLRGLVGDERLAHTSDTMLFAGTAAASTALVLAALNPIATLGLVTDAMIAQNLGNAAMNAVNGTGTTAELAEAAGRAAVHALAGRFTGWVGVGLKGMDIAFSAKDAKQDFSNAIDQFKQGNHGLAAMSALGGIANLANAVGRFGEIRKLMNCDLAGARMLGLPCFVAGTLVSTPSGPKPIESILSGDTVWGFDQRAGLWRSCMVSYHSSIDYDDLVVTVRAGGAEVRSTYHHPYWVVSGEELDERPVPDQLDELGMAVEGGPGRWVDAGDLREGDVLVSRSGGQSTVESVATEHQQTTVYHIYVEDSHNYAVGDCEWLVHNAHIKNGADDVPSPRRGGETAATKRGRQAHKDRDYGPGYEKEFRKLPSGKRPDAVDVPNGHVIELKPNNPAAIARGQKQLERYIKELEELYGIPFTGRVETYDP